MTAEQTSEDLRRYPRLRIPTPFPCAFSLSGGPSRADGLRVGLGIVYDISRYGAKVMSETVPLQGDQVTVTLQLPCQTAPMKIDIATIKWRGSQEFGLEFTALSELATTGLHQLMAQTLTDRTQQMSDLASIFQRNKGDAIFGFCCLDPARLDYSVGSLRHVSQYLEQIRRMQGIEAASVGVAVYVGAYLGEVIRRNGTGCSWFWIDYDAARSLDAQRFERLGCGVGTAAVLYSGTRDCVLPLGTVDRYLNGNNEQDLFEFAQTILTRG
jgi:hypothetical protein